VDELHEFIADRGTEIVMPGVHENLLARIVAVDQIVRPLVGGEDTRGSQTLGVLFDELHREHVGREILRTRKPRPERDRQQ